MNKLNKPPALGMIGICKLAPYEKRRQFYFKVYAMAVVKANGMRLLLLRLRLRQSLGFLSRQLSGLFLRKQRDNHQ